jgi:SAM-dependent methyltransferase
VNLKDTYNRIAKDWHADHLKDDWWSKVTDIFAGLVKTGDSILDAGCGSGIKSKYLAEKGFKVTGFDFSEEMIEIAKHEAPGIEFFVHDLYEVDTTPGQFDGIFMEASLLHISKVRAGEVVKKATSKLKLGGYFYIAVKGMRDTVEEESAKESDYGYEYERFFSYYNIDEVVNYLKSAGCEIVYEGEKKVASRWIQVIGKKTHEVA